MRFRAHSTPDRGNKAFKTLNLMTGAIMEIMILVTLALLGLVALNEVTDH